MKTAMFVDEAARTKIARWYETFRAALPFETETRTIETSAGATHVLVAGPKDAPPLVCLHGALASSAHFIRELGSLVETRRIYAVDVIGQSVMSADKRLELADDSYGTWLGEVAGGLGLDRFALFGVSWGGFVALRATRTMPERITALALMVPAGIVPSPAWAGFVDLGWPMLTYRFAPSEKRLKRVVDALFTTYDEQWAKYFGDALLHYRLDMRVPPLFEPADLAGYSGPVLVLAGDRDVSFPGPALIARMKELFPRSGVELELLENCKHCPPFDESFRERTARRIAAFLGDGVTDRA